MGIIARAIYIGLVVSLITFLFTGISSFAAAAWMFFMLVLVVKLSKKKRKRRIIVLYRRIF
ncbi:MAG: hypothetical protein DRJ55_01430 [Thermoprotei archaeon]|nr:hypothetical protein [Thermoproteales archaeon]RLE95671.1 MAG: hypothetical protein DRJ55_01430 [Thermoprotei archaeon]HDJ97036.1 hypothetical protein [Thermofilum sp.]